MKLISFLATALLSVSAFAADVPTVRNTLDFGLVPHNGQRTRVVTLTHQSETPLTLISAKMRGTDFYFKHNCPQTLNNGESCQAKITFWAAREGYAIGRLTVVTSETNYIFELSGYGDRDPFANIPQPPIPPMPPRP